MYSSLKDLFYAKIRITGERTLPLDLDRGEDHFVEYRYKEHAVIHWRLFLKN